MKQEDLNHLLNSRIPDKAWNSTVSISINEGETLHQHGTGTLFKIGDASFIITAGHVVKLAKENDRILCMAVGKSASYVQLHGTWICSAENQGYDNSDLFDIAVLRLQPETVQKITNKSFLGIIDVDTDSNLGAGIFSLFGFPSQLSLPSTNVDKKMVLKPFQYTTYAHEGEANNLERFVERYHFLLGSKPKESTDINGNPMKITNRNGEILDFPLGLRGISGCSVWKIGEYDKPINTWEKERPRLVGVQTAVYNNSQLIKVTKWIAVSTIIYGAFPDLRSAMSLWYIRQ